MVSATVGIEEDKRIVEPSLATRLELLLSVCRENAIDAEYVSVSWRKGQLVVGLFEGDFKRIFAGEAVTGVRDRDSLEVVGERHGIVWKASLYSPVARQSGMVEVQL